MALHTCRDFLTIGNPLTNQASVYTLYLQAIFLRTVLGYTVVGQTNFNIESATYKKGSGSAGSVNFGGANTYAFLPNGYTVSASDINRILAVKSANNPMVNSGLFRVTGVDVANNYLFINYRSGDSPPVETGLTWALYADENVFQANINTTGNGLSSQYSGRTTATQSRIILQSPSTLNWQVRVAVENSTDGNSATGPTGGSGFGYTTMPGYGGDSAGDFQPGGEHTHFTLWLNTNDVAYRGNTIGLLPHGCTQVRFYAWGDDVSGTCMMATRVVVGSSASDSFVHFGLAEDEEQPLPPKNVQRLFVMGANGPNGNGIYWACGPAMLRGGMSYGLSNTPISCIYSTYNPVDGASMGSGSPAARATTAAGDCLYLSATELLPVDLLVGTQDNQHPSSTTPELLVLEGRRLGRAPFMRLGRSNYGYFQVASDSNRSWIHLNDGIYLPWQGAILP